MSTPPAEPPLQRPLTGTVTLEPDPVEKTYLTRYLHGQATLGEREGGGKRNPQHFATNDVEWIRNYPQRKQN